jgi:hypothetical protein
MQMWMVGQWAQARTLHHALTADKDLPPASKEESEKKTNWGKMAQARAFREQHDHEFRQALSSPKHFGVFLGMGGVLGEPPPESIKTLDEVKAEERERNKRIPEESKLYFLEDSILARAAREGREFTPANESELPPT